MDPSSAPQVDVLLGWALIESGRVGEAVSRLATWGLPEAGGESPFAFFVFPRVFYLRSVVLAKEGQKDEAARDLKLFRELSGSLPD